MSSSDDIAYSSPASPPEFEERNTPEKDAVDLAYPSLVMEFITPKSVRSRLASSCPPKTKHVLRTLLGRKCTLSGLVGDSVQICHLIAKSTKISALNEMRQHGANVEVHSLRNLVQMQATLHLLFDKAQFAIVPTMDTIRKVEDLLNREPTPTYNEIFSNADSKDFTKWFEYELVTFKGFKTPITIETMRRIPRNRAWHQYRSNENHLTQAQKRRMQAIVDLHKLWIDRMEPTPPGYVDPADKADEGEPSNDGNPPDPSGNGGAAGAEPNNRKRKGGPGGGRRNDEPPESPTPRRPGLRSGSKKAGQPPKKRKVNDVVERWIQQQREGTVSRVSPNYGPNTKAMLFLNMIDEDQTFALMEDANSDDEDGSVSFYGEDEEAPIYTDNDTPSLSKSVEAYTHTELNVDVGDHRAAPQTKKEYTLYSEEEQRGNTGAGPVEDECEASGWSQATA
ncbi:hypothetical protein CALCODRAFT_506556 [Calocera cornea HHB12733]|uniref:HNH nuclease domain-containing protein n=1 Tax=Calocera cornea HHB12733 TaxID=1353952 RepID=A0A165ISK4_9BASI|nr:hypothetical protein CALCODRAFT_506556 [Calocera cornea HHB12733]